MDCGIVKQQLLTQLDDLEKNRGICNSLKDSLTNNILLSSLSKLVKAQKSKWANLEWKDMLKQLSDQAGNPIGTLQAVLSGTFNSVGNFQSIYYYYVVKNQLLPSLKTRYMILLQIRGYLFQVRQFLDSNFFFRLSPSAKEEVKVLLGYLENAQRALLMIPYERVTRFNTDGDVISSKMELPSLLALDPGADLVDALKSKDYSKLANFHKNTFVYYTQLAYKWLEEAQRYLRSLAQKKNLTKKQIEFQKKLQEFLDQNNVLLAGIAKLIPVMFVDTLTAFNNKDNIGQIFQKELNKVVGRGDQKTLSLLNGRIRLTKAVLSDFETLAPMFRKRCNEAVLREAARYSNIELDKLVEDIRTVQYPSNLADFFLKSPAWYARMEEIKASLWFFDFSKISLETQVLGPELHEWHGYLKELMKDPSDYASMFTEEIRKSFPELVKILYIGNILKASEKRASVDTLIALCERAIEQDYKWISLIEISPEPPEYAAFEHSFNAGMNSFVAKNTFGFATMAVVETLKNGTLLAVPASIGMNVDKAKEEFMNNIGNIQEQLSNVNGIVDSISFFKEGFNFNKCDTLKDKNLFANPEQVQDFGGITDSIGDAYKELWTSLANRPAP